MGEHKPWLHLNCRCSAFPVGSHTQFSYEEFINTVKTVLNINADTKANIMEIVVAESTKSDFNIWKTILKDVI